MSIKKAKELIEKRDFKSALPLLETLANKGDTWAQWNLGKLYLYGQVVEKNIETAILWCEKAAGTGDPEAQYHLGEVYNDYSNPDKDKKKAFSWYEKSAEQGNLDATFSMGLIFQYGGDGIKESPKKAFECYMKCAEGGIDHAQLLVAKAYMYGDGVKKDKAASNMWMKKAADNGSKEAREWLGYDEEKDDDDEGHSGNYELMLTEELKDLTEEGDLQAMYQLGCNYIAGNIDDEDIELDDDKKTAIGVKYLKLAAGKGFSDAQYYLATLYEQGIKIKADPAAAKVWMKKAADSGHKTAISKLKNLAKK